jgi:alpha-amylase/alpha-mannosidase (GH57 family)
MNRYVCIHGHFYQPPRENPWLEAIELQDSASPYHDWNERIMAECYAPNAAARILDDKERIEQIVNNYSRISFNFGPTLLSWMEEKASRVYQAILDADAESRSRFSGHGSALAQVYNHMILPLASARDRRTQVLWGIRDFERRFGRSPEGMWLPETAADLQTLDVLAELGIRFTVLAPSQAARVRRRSGGRWRDVSGDRIDPTRAYRLRLPSQRSIELFFYDGPISRAVAFEGLLRNGEDFAHRIVGGFSSGRDWPQLVHIATDGETYGHHQHRGDMALAYALRYIEENELARLTNYGEYLERHPPTHDVEIIENTSWSCVHGVERWRSDCGCKSGARPGWQQAWRAPLREALDGLRDATAGPFEDRARGLLADPWRARDDYVGVVLDRTPESIARFLGGHATGELSAGNRTTALKLLELQRHAMLMYTSCGWFFDEISGIETVQVLQYAGRVLQLAGDLFGGGFEDPFLEILSRAPSNLPAVGNGRTVYERYVRPATVDLSKVGAHYAVSSLFENYGESARIYAYGVDREDFLRLDAGRARLGLGRATFTSRTTAESELLTFGVLQFGGHNVNGGVRPFRGDEEYETLVRSVAEAFNSADLTEVIRRLDEGFGRDILSLKLLFRDEQRKILDRILQSTLTDTEALLRQAYEANVPLMRFLAALNTPLPSVFHAIAEFVLNTQLRQALDGDEPDRDRVERLLDEVDREHVVLAEEAIEFTLRRRIESLAVAFAETPDDDRLERLRRGVVLASRMPFPVELWEVQNAYFGMLQSVYPERLERARRGDTDARSWAERFAELGDLLFVRVPERPNGPDA